MANPRTPTPIKALLGTARPDRANPNEPESPALSVGSSPPSWVKSKEARGAWKALIEVAPVGVITQMDALSLGLLVSAFGDWLEARRTLDKEGRYYETEGASGRMVRAHPAVADEADTWRRAVTLLGKFGMNPSDRSRVSAGGVTEDPVGSFIDSRRSA
jgi:P27 family predicted phage terminase small subunit